MKLIDDIKNQIEDEYKHNINQIFEIFNLNLLSDYYLFLREFSEIGGFFSKSDIERIASRHIYESMIYIYHLNKQISVSRETHLIDVGSGPGIPGFLFYSLISKPKVTLLDSSKRRLKYVEEFIKKKGLKDIEIVYHRIEEWNKTYDIAVARALIPFPFNAILMKHSFRNVLCLFSAKLEINHEMIELLKQNNLKVDVIIPILELKFLGERNLILLSLIDKQKKMKPVKWKDLRRFMDEFHHSNSESKRWSR